MDERGRVRRDARDRAAVGVHDQRARAVPGRLARLERALELSTAAAVNGFAT